MYVNCCLVNAKEYSYVINNSIHENQFSLCKLLDQLNKTISFHEDLALIVYY